MLDLVVIVAPADFPDAFRANMWAQHLSDKDSDADSALSDFTVRCV